LQRDNPYPGKFLKMEVGLRDRLGSKLKKGKVANLVNSTLYPKITPSLGV